jgi:hypothetical protein
MCELSENLEVKSLKLKFSKKLFFKGYNSLKIIL